MRPLQISIDASRTTTAQRTGTENYALQLIRAMLALDTPHHFTLYFRDPPPSGLFPGNPRATWRIIPWRRMWTHSRFTAELWRRQPDVTFVPAHTLPLWFPGPSVVTIHDLGYIYFPSAHPDPARRYLAWSTRHSAKRATRIIVDSLATSRDLAAHYGVSENRINLVYPGVDESLAPVSDPAQLKAVRAAYNLPERYLLFIGTLQPRKNIARIVQAFSYWQAKQTNSDVALVLAGPKGWLYDPNWTAGTPNVFLPGYIQDSDIAALYSGALALVFPTLYEGFGFPVLEAMRCGTPVITSTSSSLPEVAGNAALLVNPRDTESIAAAIDRIIKDQTLRADLVRKGFEQAARFTWTHTAEQTMQVLEMAARSS